MIFALKTGVKEDHFRTCHHLILVVSVRRISMFGHLQQIRNRFDTSAPRFEQSANQGNSLNQLVWKTLRHHIFNVKFWFAL